MGNLIVYPIFKAINSLTDTFTTFSQIDINRLLRFSLKTFHNKFYNMSHHRKMEFHPQ